MKKIYMFVASAFVAATSFGQTNLSFEDPITHPAADFGVPEVGSTTGWGVGIFEASTDATNGAQSVKLTTANNPLFVQGGLPATSSGEALQSVAGPFLSNGAYITATVDFKYAPVSGDTALIVFEVYDTLAAGFNDDVLLYSGTLIIIGAQTTWATEEITLDAVPNATGTANELYFGGLSSYRQKSVGSTLDMDNWTINLGTVGVENLESSSFKAFPNPAVNVLNITNSEEIATVSIMSLDGKLVSTTNGGKVDVSSLNGGIYIYEATTISGKKAINKFVKK